MDKLLSRHDGSEKYPQKFTALSAPDVLSLRNFIKVHLRQQRDKLLSNSSKDVDYSCATQPANQKIDPQSLIAGDKEGTARQSLIVGSGDGTITLWDTQSVINWTVNSSTFPNATEPNWYGLALCAMSEAAEAWMSKINAVSFRYVSDPNDAAFVVEYKEQDAGDPSAYAKSYFPSDHDVLNIVYVYRTAYTVGDVSRLANRFEHELGHVMGLRHEFVIPDRENNEPGPVRYGPANPLSIMSYDPKRSIQDSDWSNVQRLYWYFPAGSKLFGLTIVKVSPDN